MAFEDFYKKRPAIEDEGVVLPEEQQVVPAEKTEDAKVPQIAGIQEATERPKKSKVDMSWWRSPNYAAAERELQDRAMLSMEAQERRAINERRAALLGDIARLGAQMWAKKGGAWAIPRNESQTAVANNRLQQLRDKHAGDMLMYAQRLQAAKDADRKDAMNREETRMSLEAQQQAQAAAQQQAQDAAQQQAFNNYIEKQKLENAQQNAAARFAIDTQRLNEDNRYRAEQMKIAKQRADAYEKNVGKTNKKTVTYTSPDGRESYTVSDSVVKANIGTLYDIIRQDLGDADNTLQHYIGLESSYAGGTSQNAMLSVVSALWHKSDKAKAYLKLLSESEDVEDWSEDVEDWSDDEDNTIVDF